ncbi:ATP synthase subunit J, mitochondrial [Trichomonascus vanleenenianus]|uniref:F1F0 ATP synthase subunit i n=1 Tax=Trichomonascus vanleenenianus TaxID=2268995 RepID=UPI003ECA95E8
MFRFDTFARYNFPLLKTYWPFAIGGLVTLYAIKQGADAMALTPEYIDDPRNRLAILQKKHEKH